MAELTAYEDKIKNFNGTQEQQKQLVDELNSKYGKTLGTYQTLSQWQDVLTKKGAAYAKTLMLEAQSQAVLNKYSEAYIAVIEAQQRLQSLRVEQANAGFLDDLSGRSKAIRFAMIDAMNQLKQSQKDADQYLKRFIDINRQIDKISSANNFNPPSGGTNTPKVTTKTTSTKNNADKEAKARLDALRKAEDAEIALIKDLHEKERKETELKFKRQIEDIKGNSEEEQRLRVALQKQMDDALAALEQKYSDEAVKAEQERIQKMLAIVEKGTQEELNL